jgi:quercetin dioxygenase-like cupin family protein
MSVIRNRDVPSFEIQGSVITGLATPSHGAREVEVWHSMLAPGSGTPPHVHDAEEVVVVLRGRGELRVGEQSPISFAAPCTLIAPAGLIHQIVNVGTETVESVAALPLGSSITLADGTSVPMPWRD